MAEGLNLGRRLGTVDLGNTGLKVSRLCFGTLTMGPLQRNLPLDQGAKLIRRAIRLGVNFFDTAEIYDTYPYIRRALDDLEHKHRVEVSSSERAVQGDEKPEAGVRPLVIATKSYAWSREAMQESLDRARRELNLDCIGVFLLHEQESALTLKGHRGAIECLLGAKSRGLVKAVGISTHSVQAVRAASRLPEIDVISPLLNLAGIGIRDGGLRDMLDAVACARAAGKGIYTMKALGGGHLSGEAVRALRFVLGLSEVDSVAVGIQTFEELCMNVLVAMGAPVPAKLAAKVLRRSPELLIEAWCNGCGACVERCGSRALSLQDGRAVVDKDLCVHCGYCGSACPDFAIKIV